MNANIIRSLSTALTLVALSMLMIGCGGGTMVATEGGIGGTGISSGTITAFGSIFVNGVEYDISRAQISTPDNSNATQADLRLGMVVTVTTNTNNNGTVSVGQVIYRDEVRGVVDTKSIQPVAGTLTVLGQSITVDARTAFGGDKAFYAALDPAGKLAVLQGLGAVVVQVSGIRNGEGIIHATRIRVLKDYVGESEVRGIVENLGVNGQESFKIRGLSVDYRSANIQFTPANDMAVVVYGNVNSATNSLVATHIEQDLSSIETKLRDATYKVASIQGIVTKLDSTAPKTFYTRGVLVDYSSAQLDSEAGAATLADNALVEVNGAVDMLNGIPRIIATNIEIESSDVGNLQRIESGQVIAAPDATTHTVRVLDPANNNAEILVKIETSTYFRDELKTDPFNYSTVFSSANPSLGSGDLLEVKGYLSPDGGTLVATMVERLKM